MRKCDCLPSEITLAMTMPDFNQMGSCSIHKLHV